MHEIYGNTTTTPINPDAFSGGGNGENIVIDQTYDAASENAQSGKAVAEAVKPLENDIGNISIALENIIAIQKTLIGGGSV